MYSSSCPLTWTSFSNLISVLFSCQFLLALFPCFSSFVKPTLYRPNTRLSKKTYHGQWWINEKIWKDEFWWWNFFTHYWLDPVLFLLRLFFNQKRPLPIQYRVHQYQCVKCWIAGKKDGEPTMKHYEG
jgi:hypothetical protein